MRTITIFLGICTIFTAICAVPVSHLQERTQFNHDHISASSNSHVKSVISLRHLSTMHTRDFFSDMIRAILNMSVKELLLYVEQTYKDLDRVTNQGVDALNNVLPLTSPEIRNKIETIRDNALKRIFETIDELLKDLGSVLPALSFHRSIHDPSADIVYALLGQTLEELVTALAKALEASLNLLNQTMIDFVNLAAQASPEVAKALDHVSDEYLNQGKSIIIPTLDKLRQIVDSSVHVHKLVKFNTQKQHRDLLDGVISTILGINIQNAATETDNALSQLAPLIESTRDELKNALIQNVDNQDSESNIELVEKIENIYDSTIDDIIRDTKPIFLSLLNFNDEMRRDKTFTNNLENSLLGIGILNLKTYAQNVSSRVENRIKLALSEIVVSSLHAGLPVAIKVFRVIRSNLNSAKLISEPLLELLRPILQCKNDQSESIENTINSLVVYDDVDKEGWNEDDGFAYNRDPLINATSTLLGFQVSEATEILKTALEHLDELTDGAFGELEMILYDEEPGLKLEISDVMNETLTNIHVMLQPMLDVLLPFLPDSIRPNKQVATDIYNGINGVIVERFLNYCSFVARKIPEITDIATINIKTAAARAGPVVHGKIDYLLSTSDGNIKAIIKPFLDIISPIISPR